ncbi:MAG TPA: hypothetical protein ENN17_01085 [bacterium]|nr:hypothetical protein [bacterium]
MFRLHDHGSIIGLLLIGILALTFGITCTQKSPLDPSESLHERAPMLVDMTASPGTVGVNGAFSVVRVRLLDEDRAPFRNAWVRFSASAGSVTDSARTDTSGFAQAIYRSGQREGTVTVTARYGDAAVQRIQIAIVQKPDFELVIQAERKSLLANGIDSTNISILYSASDFDPSKLSVNTTAGRLSYSPRGDRLLLTSPVSTTDILSVVTVSYDQYMAVDTVKFRGIWFTLEASPDQILADGRSVSRVMAVLKETSSSLAIPNQKVSFGATLGLIPMTGQTDVRGVVEADLTSATTSGTSEVTATYGATLTRRVSVGFLPSEPTYMVVTVSPPVIPADGTTASTITAVVTDFSNNPVPAGIPVTFTRLTGPNVNFQNQKQTDENGRASTSLTALGLGTAVIEVVTALLRDTVTVACIEGPVDQVTLITDKEEIRADAIETALLTATVQDAQGFRLAREVVHFSATIGNITETAVTDQNGTATARFSSGQVGSAVVTASVARSGGGAVSASRTIRLTAGGPFSVNLEFNPKEIGVKETGQNQTLEIIATVRDGKNNIVDDSTLVRFSIIRDEASPRHPDISLYSIDGSISYPITTTPIPTVAGAARVSCSSGIIAGSARIRAEVLQSNGMPHHPTIQATSTPLVVHAGPPYIEDVNDVRTSHLTIVARRLNIWAGLDTTLLTVIVGDRYNNPVETGTAVYFTTSGGVVTTNNSFTNEGGLLNQTITAANPQPTVNRFYLYEGLQDPNTGQILEPPNQNGLGFTIPDFDDGAVINTYDNSHDPTGRQNNGVARIIAWAEGMDAAGRSAKAWDWLPLVFSTNIAWSDENSLSVIAAVGDTIAFQGQNKRITLTIWDRNGNPIASGSRIRAETVPTSIQAKIEPAEIITGKDMGQVHYNFSVGNAIEIGSAGGMKPGWVSIKFTVDSPNGKIIDMLSKGQFFIAPP